MKTIRRIYFYAVALVSMEIVLWGMIGLARSGFSPATIGGTTSLAQALALIFVGVPIFGFHWLSAQRAAKQDAEERASWVRAFFLYAVLLALLIPFVQNFLALINTLLADLFKLPSSSALFDAYQSQSDHLIAMLMNGVLALYFLYVLREDWEKLEEKSAFLSLRRIYRYLWVLYALTLALSGVGQILYYLFSAFSAEIIGRNASGLVNGIALVLVGVPLWVWTWSIVQKAHKEAAERESLLRLGVLYFLSFLGVLFFLASSGVVIDEFLLLLLGRTKNFTQFMQNADGALAVGLTFGILWAYYGYWLHRDLDALPNTPRRAAFNRLYAYVLAFVGLSAAFVGIGMLLSFVIDSLFTASNWYGNLESRLAAALSMLFVGLPLWLKAWFPMQAEARTEDEAGAHARRSSVRRTYLYLLIFVGVVGGMISAVILASLIFETLLGSTPNEFWNDFLNALQAFILFAGLFAYHWKTLKEDGTRHSAVESEKTFTALLLDNGDETLLSELASLTEAEVQKINWILQNPAETPPPADALILPLDLLLAPSETLKSTLREFNGSKFLFTRETETWLWRQSPRQLAASIRQLAEGEKIQEPKKTSAWMVVVYILAGITAVEIAFFLLAILLSL